MDFTDLTEMTCLFNFDGFDGGGISTQYIPDFDRDLYMNDVNELLSKSPKIESSILNLDELVPRLYELHDDDLEMAFNEDLDLEFSQDLPLYALDRWQKKQTSELDSPQSPPVFTESLHYRRHGIGTEGDAPPANTPETMHTISHLAVNGAYGPMGGERIQSKDPERMDNGNFISSHHRFEETLLSNLRPQQGLPQADASVKEQAASLSIVKPQYHKMKSTYSNSTQFLSSLSNALKYKNTQMKHEDSSPKLDFSNQTIQTTVCFFPYGKSFTFEESIPYEMKVSEVIRFLFNKYYKFSNLPTVSTNMFELRLIEEDDGLPDMELMPINYNRIFGKLYVKEIAFCTKDKEIQKLLVLHPPSIPQMHSQKPTEDGEIAQAELNLSLTVTKVQSDKSNQKSLFENDQNQALTKNVFFDSAYSCLFDEIDDHVDCGKHGEEFEIKQKPLEASEDEEDVYDELGNPYSNISVLNKQFAAIAPNFQEPSLRQQRSLTMLHLHSSKAKYGKEGEEEKPEAHNLNYFADFDFDREESAQSNDNNSFSNTLSHFSNAKKAFANKHNLPAGRVQSFEYSPSERNVKDNSKSLKGRTKETGMSAGLLDRCFSAYTHGKRERVFTVVTPEYASKTFKIDPVRIEGRLGPGGIKDIVIVAIREDARVFELCAKVAKAMRAETLSRLAFERLTDGDALDMGASIASIPVDEQTLMIFRQTRSSVRQNSPLAVIEKRPPLAMFIYTEYTAAAVCEYFVTYQVINESKGTFNPSHMQNAILTVDGERICHSLQPNDNLDTTTGKGIPQLSYATSSMTLIRSTYGNTEAHQTSPTGFLRPLFQKLSGQSLNWTSFLPKQKVEYPPTEQYIWEILSVYLEPKRQRDFYIVYPERRKLPGGNSKAVCVSYTAETPSACAEIVAKLTFLLLHTLRKDTFH